MHIKKFKVCALAMGLAISTINFSGLHAATSNILTIQEVKNPVKQCEQALSDLKNNINKICNLSFQQNNPAIELFALQKMLGNQKSDVDTLQENVDFLVAAEGINYKQTVGVAERLNSIISKCSAFDDKTIIAINTARNNIYNLAKYLKAHNKYFRKASSLKIDNKITVGECLQQIKDNSKVIYNFYKSPTVFVDYLSNLNKKIFDVKTDAEFQLRSASTSVKSELEKIIAAANEANRFVSSKIAYLFTPPAELSMGLAGINNIQYNHDVRFRVMEDKLNKIDIFNQSLGVNLDKQSAQINGVVTKVEDFSKVVAFLDDKYLDAQFDPILGSTLSTPITDTVAQWDALVTGSGSNPTTLGGNTSNIITIDRMAKIIQGLARSQSLYSSIKRYQGEYHDYINNSVGYRFIQDTQKKLLEDLYNNVFDVYLKKNVNARGFDIGAINEKLQYLVKNAKAETTIEDFRKILADYNYGQVYYTTANVIIHNSLKGVLNALTHTDFIKNIENLSNALTMNGINPYTITDYNTFLGASPNITVSSLINGLIIVNELFLGKDGAFGSNSVIPATYTKAQFDALASAFYNAIDTSGVTPAFKTGTNAPFVKDLKNELTNIPGFLETLKKPERNLLVTTTT